jgi:hypothetical protein
MLRKFSKILVLVLSCLVFCSFPMVSSCLGNDTTAAEIQILELNDFLRSNLQFSDSQFASMKRGEVVTKILDTGEISEVAVFGIVRVDVPADFFLHNYGSRVDFMETNSALEVGKFSSIPSLNDVQNLSLDQSDLEALKTCKIGNCDVKLPARFMERFHQEVNWSATDHEEQAAALFRSMVVAYVQSYLAGGDTALMEYDDKNYPLHLLDEYRDLLRESPYVYVYVPEFHQYLQEFPRGEMSSVENYVYWLKEDIKAKHKLTSITHLVAYEPQERNFHLVTASKQIYASHYFEASLALSALVNDPEGVETRVYLVYIDRSRIDSLRKDIPILRKEINEQMLNMLVQQMSLVKTKMEGTYRVKK